MGLGRRKIRLEDQAAWVFNRMAEAYPARPAYPRSLIDAVVALLPTGARRVLDLGAGIGHLAVPLAERGLEVVAVEPAQAMLEVLQKSAAARALQIRALHATAEALPLAEASFDLVVVADALHFLDAELAGAEVARVLTRGGGLALLTCGLGDTPFMRSVVHLMEESAPRRPRDIAGATLQFLKMVRAEEEGSALSFSDETPVDQETLEQILRSISFIGPAMNAERFARFAERLRALPEPRAWARTFRLTRARRR
ncbi:MAG: class I SAM-dependent methyltransferase [Myxococcales bacterium]